MAEPYDDDPKHWHLDKRLNLSHFVTTLMMAASIMWWGAAMDRRVAVLEEARLSQRQTDERQDADSLSGSGGTQSAGGTSTGISANGSYLQGASANNGDSTTRTAKTGGGGGGGYYGGGAAGTDYADAGGGGGSGYIGGPGVSSAATYTGNYHIPPAERPATINDETVAPRGNGVPGLYTERGQDGHDGVIWLEVLA